jgi:DNA-binding CsgD family transcriptional regulator
VVEGAERDGFVGREEELERLRSALARAAEGRGGTVIIGGEAGIGKSRLLERFAQEAEGDGARVLIGACLEFGEAGPPYGPFVEALRYLVRTTRPDLLATLLGPGRTELSRLLPELGSRSAAPEAPSLDLDRSAQGRLFEQVLGVLERLARASSVVIGIEDLQWSDSATRDLLAFLVRALRRSPVLFVVTARTEELHRRGRVLPFLAELQRDEGVERIELEAFGPDELAAQIESILGRPAEPELVEAVLARTNGNPFFTEQLVEAAGTDADEETDLPPQLRDVLLARVATLSDPAQEVLRAASAAGRRTDDALLAAVLELPDRRIAAALREALARGILVDAIPAPGIDGGYAFRHTLLREVVYGELFTGERLRLHAGFARSLEERGEVGGAPVGPADIAYHWDAARDPGHALPALVEAARAAELVYAWAEARQHYERALELWDRVPDAAQLVGADRVTLLIRTAEMCVLRGGYARAIELGRAAIAEQAASGDPEPVRQGMLQERLRWFLWEAGDRDGARAAVAEAIRLIPAEPASAPRARALAQQAALELYDGHFEAARTGGEQAVQAARAAGAPSEEALALGIVGWAKAVVGDVDAGVAMFRDGLAIAERVGGVEGIALGYTNLSAVLDRVGRTEDALVVASEGIAIARRFGVERTYGGILAGHAAKALLDLGRWDEAAAILAEGPVRAAAGRPAVWLRILRARLDTAQGRWEAAANRLRVAREADESLGGTQYRPALLAALAELGAWQGRLPDVRATADEARLLAKGDSPPHPALRWVAVHALRAEADTATRALARRDDTGLAEARGRAAEIAGGLAPVATTEAGTVPASGRDRALDALCAAELARANADDKPDGWGAVADAWTDVGRPYHAAYGRYRQAEATLGDRGPKEAAMSALREAHAIVVRLAAAPLLRDVELLARHARIELLQARTAGPDRLRSPDEDAIATMGLTERETEVIRLVAGGWSNQQIADSLFISRKTASVHVSNILGKLGVGSRVEAAAIAHRLGLGRDAPSPPDSVLP